MDKSFLGLMILLSCLLGGQQTFSQINTVYAGEIEEWQTSRIEKLKAENGWLNLVGLYWLDKGKNSFGADKKNKIVFPEGTIPPEAGYFKLSGKQVRIVTKKNIRVSISGKQERSAIIFNADSARQPVIAYGDLRWTIIKRDNKTGVRLRNLKSPALTGFKGIERYDADSAWKITALLQIEGRPKKIPITNVLGQTTEQISPGKLIFSIGDKRYALDALEEDDQLFLIFGDETSGVTTYPSGRFLLAAKPDTDGKTILDFNKAYNPPCAFTEFATCPLPPRQNILPIPIKAGEKNYHLHQ